MKTHRIGMDLLRGLAALSAVAGLAGCTADSSISASGPSSGGGDGSSFITITKFQNQTSVFGIEVGSGSALSTVVNDFQFDGTCARGLKAVNIQIKPPSGSYAYVGSAECTADQLFTWSKASIGADGVYAVRFLPVNGLDVELGAAFVDREIIIDTTPPPIPTSMTVEGLAAADGSIKIVVSPTPSVAGVISSDTRTVVLSTMGNFYSGLTCSGAPLCIGMSTCNAYSGETEFCFVPTLSDGESRQLSISARDVLGNTSSPFQVTVAFIPPLASDPKHIQFSAMTMMPQTESGVTLVRASHESFEGEGTLTQGGVTYRWRAGKVAYLIGLE